MAGVVAGIRFAAKDSLCQHSVVTYIAFHMASACPIDISWPWIMWPINCSRPSSRMSQWRHSVAGIMIYQRVPHSFLRRLQTAGKIIHVITNEVIRFIRGL